MHHAVPNPVLLLTLEIIGLVFGLFHPAFVLAAIVLVLFNHLAR